MTTVPDETVTVRMTERVTYTNQYTVAELASLLDVDRTRDAVLAALDTDNSDYGTTSGSEYLLDDMVDNHLQSVEDRAWEVD